MDLGLWPHQRLVIYFWPPVLDTALNSRLTGLIYSAIQFIQSSQPFGKCYPLCLDHVVELSLKRQNLFGGGFGYWERNSIEKKPRTAIMADDQAIFNPSSAEKMALRVLCFGASITAGWSAGGSHHYPYSIQLSARLADALPATHFSIEVDGFSGDTLINGQYTNRMQQDMKSVKVAYDWVIVQAGGNDLGWGRQPEAIFNALKPFWEIPLSTGANVLALTVTEHGNDNAEQFAKRETLNSLISNYTDSNHTFAGGNYYVADVATAIPYKTMSEGDRKLFWSDDTHFTQEGYRLMGDVISDRLIDLIQGNHVTLNSTGAMKATFKL